MKIGIVSDIHGNLPAFKAVLGVFSRHRVSDIICAGDIVGYYPFVNEVVEEMRGIGAISIIGNHDDALIRGSDIKESFSASAAIRYARKEIRPINLDYLSSLPVAREVRIGGVDITIFHGMPHDPLNGRIRSAEDIRWFRIRPGVAVGGHTHVPVVSRLRELVYINPGSCGQPRDFDIRASCAVLDLDAMTVEFPRELYDLDSVDARMAELEFDPRISWSLYAGEWVGGSKLDFASGLARASEIDGAYECLDYRYCVHLRHRETSARYNCYVQDGRVRLVSSPIYRNGKAPMEIGVDRFKVKMNAVAAFKILIDDRVLRPEHLAELEASLGVLGAGDGY